MSGKDLRLALGLMSGTSMDGIDAALIRSDGQAQVESIAFRSTPYDAAFRARLRAALGGKGPVADVERELTLRHAEAVRDLLATAGMAAELVALVGFHGHTILHEPAQGRTWQIGDGALLAAKTGIDVVADLRHRDIELGGEGAPLAPIYHAALSAALEKPLAVLNIGGVANVTWIGSDEGDLMAFDCGPGNALINDWVEARTGQPFDDGGRLAAAGRVEEAVLQSLLDDPYFDLPAPKSLDRDHFDPAPVAGLSLEDGSATLAAFTAAAVAKGRALMPQAPRRWLVTGGGRHNPVLMADLGERLGAPVAPVEAVGWNGDALEAEAFAYLALRSRAGLPISFPGTTGVKAAATGGRLFPATG